MASLSNDLLRPLSPIASAPAVAGAPGACAWDDEEELARYTRFFDREGERVAESSFVIEGMYCAACSVTIEQALRALPGVDDADVNPATRRARVRWRPARVQASALVHAVESAGYRAYPAYALQAEQGRDLERRLSLWRVFVAGFCMMQVMMYAVPVYVAGPGDMTEDVRRLLNWASWILSIPVVLFAAGPFLKAAWLDLRHRRIGMDVPVALGILVAFVASTGAAFDPGGIFGEDVYFDSLTMFVFFLLCGRHLELRAREATAGALEALMHRLPQTVERLREDGTGEEVPVHRLRTGDRVRVRAGQAFPGDGTLIEGTAQVDEALLTGESHPVLRRPGDPVVAGSISLSSAVVMRVERTGEATRYAQIVQLMEKAAAERPSLARLADRIAAPFLWAVLAIAFGGALAWGFIDPSRSVWVAVAVLIVTCPCALSLATPAAVLAAAAALARRGVLVQRLGALETLAAADVFVFDKTGTLTQDRLTLREVTPFSRVAQHEALAHAAALAQVSLHPVSRALAASAPSLPVPMMTEVHEHAGQGVEGRDAQGRRWRLGSASFAGAEAWPQGEGPRAWISVEGRVLARLDFEETLREEGAAVVSQLRRAGAQVWLLSGDRAEAARRVAASLGVDGIEAQATPQSKLQFVERLQAQGHRVVMVGDGLNDAPVLARADVSVAMGQGADLARMQGDLVLLGNRLAALVEARALARRMVSVIRQNLAWAAGYNAVSIPLALVGWLPPWVAGLGMAASSLLVVLNAWRLNRHASPASAQAIPHAAVAMEG
ncbi:heavy metal translocating P-type ATPase [Schlegelella aquatica]|uniref:heavy metal translocating P-type ATPase n=1 Tax=Caldimonas aquatica TaxID=376175 RepID=UPI003750BBF6